MGPGTGHAHHRGTHDATYSLLVGDSREDLPGVLGIGDERAAGRGKVRVDPGVVELTRLVETVHHLAHEAWGTSSVSGAS